MFGYRRHKCFQRAQSLYNIGFAWAFASLSLSPYARRLKVKTLCCRRRPPATTASAKRVCSLSRRGHIGAQESSKAQRVGGGGEPIELGINYASSKSVYQDKLIPLISPFATRGEISASAHMGEREFTMRKFLYSIESKKWEVFFLSFFFIRAIKKK